MKQGAGRLVSTFREYLENVPFLNIVSWKKDARLGEFVPDLLINVSLATHEQVIIADIRSSGQPRIAREAVNQLYRFRDESPGMFGVFMAPSVHPRRQPSANRPVSGTATWRATAASSSTGSTSNGATGRIPR